MGEGCVGVGSIGVSDVEGAGGTTRGGTGVGITGDAWVDAGFGVGVGMDGFEATGCVCGACVTGGFDDPPSFSKDVIGEVACVVTVGAAVETGTMRAVLPKIASGDGLVWGGGFSP